MEPTTTRTRPEPPPRPALAGVHLPPGWSLMVADVLMPVDPMAGPVEVTLQLRGVASDEATADGYVAAAEMLAKLTGHRVALMVTT